MPSGAVKQLAARQRDAGGAGFEVAAEFAISDNVSPWTVNVPAGTVAGDLLILHLSARGGGTLGVSPSGWTPLYNQATQGQVVHRTWTRVAGSSEPSTVSVTHSQGSRGRVAGLWRVRGASGVAAHDIAGGNSATPTAPSVTASAPSVLLCAWTVNSTSIDGNASMVESWTAENAGDSLVPTFRCSGAGRHEFVAAGATGTRAGASPSTDWGAVSVLAA